MAKNEMELGAKLQPKDETSVLETRNVWQQTKETLKATGHCMPREFAAGLSGLSKQRIGQLIEEGKLEGVKIGVQVFVTERSLEVFLQSDRTPGKKKTLGQKVGMLWKMARAAEKDMKAEVIAAKESKRKQRS